MSRRAAAVVVLVTGPRARAPGRRVPGKNDAAPPDTEAEATTTTTTAPLPCYPLTGLPAMDAAVAGNHPAIVVKIDNCTNSRPQTGLNRADIVVDEEGRGVTRLGLVFHSELPDAVGPCGPPGRATSNRGPASRAHSSPGRAEPHVTAEILAASATAS